MKKEKKINKLYILIGIFLIIQIISIFSATNVSNAFSESETIELADGGGTETTEADEFFSNVSSKVQSWENMGQTKLNDIGIDTSTLLSPVLSIAQTLSFVGFCVVVIYTLIHAVIRRKGNAEDKGEAKKQDIGLIITAVVLLGAYGIWKILLNALDTIASTTY